MILITAFSFFDFKDYDLRLLNPAKPSIADPNNQIAPGTGTWLGTSTKDSLPPNSPIPCTCKPIRNALLSSAAIRSLKLLLSPNVPKKLTYSLDALTPLASTFGAVESPLALR